MTATLETETEEAARLERQFLANKAIKDEGKPEQNVRYWRARAYKAEAEASWVSYVLALLDGGEMVSEGMRVAMGGDPEAQMEDGAGEGLQQELRAIWRLLADPQEVGSARARLVTVGKRLVRAIGVLKDGRYMARQMVCVKVPMEKREVDTGKKVGGIHWHYLWVTEKEAETKYVGCERF